MLILGIETSCDETAAAVVEDGHQILSDVVASSVDLHIKYGGVIPDKAAREQLSSIIPVIHEALKSSNRSVGQIDALAVTAGGPGLIGSLLIGVETAKALALAWNKPLVPVIHLLAHTYAAWLGNGPYPEFPTVSLTVSGGHTELFLLRGHGRYQWLGGTRDDASGEAFDKVARVLGLPYPGGPAIQALAAKGNPHAIKFPRPMISDKNFDFSFSGLKTAVINEIHRDPDPERYADIAASFQQAVIDVLKKKVFQAAEKYQVKNIILAGGVSANKALRDSIINESKIPVFVPLLRYCTDNATYIASSAYFNYHPLAATQIQAEPNPFVLI